ncbi:MAG TPA: helix-turn-helix domain-containing protein [Pseudonocardiaceae bacterium]|nr:helix-turn-helix domain-containing protein [Pseudonocardiaceae bacterium]
MEYQTITPRRVAQALVLSLPGSLGKADSGDITEALLAADTERTPSTLVVLDLRDVSLLTVQAARALLAFSHARAARGVQCVLVPNPASAAVRVVLDSVDPGVSVPRFATVESALAEHGITDLDVGPHPISAPPRTERIPDGRPTPFDLSGGGWAIEEPAADEPAETGSARGSPPAGATVNLQVFDSADLGRIEKFLSTAHAPVRITGASGQPSTHITVLTADLMSVDQLDLRFDFSYDVGPLGRICLCDIQSGAIEGHRVPGRTEPESFGRGDFFSVAPPDSACTGHIRRARCGIILFPPELLAQVAGIDQPVELLDHRPLDANALRHLRAAIAYLRDDVLGVPGIGDNPLVRSTASRYLAASVLNAFSNSALTAPAEENRRDAHPQTLRRAIAFIEANADREITIADIARAAYVSVRAVQLAFRRHLGLTPMAYLRQVRLACARAELRAAAHGEVTVTRVAARWGYARASVFAAHYRAAYGESPSQTLRND